MRDAALDPPLRVDWIEAAELDDGRPGRLGLTFLPGKRGPSSRYPGRVYRRELAADLATLRHLGVGRLILLVTDEELARWGDLDIVERAAAAAVAVDRFPIVDGDVPPSIAGMDAILAAIEQGRSRGDVAVACMGGVGRTGTVVACALVRAGASAAGAIGRVRAVRHPTAVETSRQAAFVAQYERHASERRRSS